MTKKVIGEGAYGCVHKPSIHCKQKSGFDYDDYVSKLMRNENAIDELNEFVVIKKYDPNNEYHLGTPEICNPDIDEFGVKESIAKCKHIDVNKVVKEPDKYKLLLLKYGGPDLSAFCKYHIQDYIKTDKDNKCDKFWLEVHHLIKGLQFFRNNGIVHNDLKPQNILFDKKTGKMMYIDFGLMSTKNTIKKHSEKSQNQLGIFHWSFPFDCGFMNKDNYSKYKDYRGKKMDKMYKNQMSNMIINNNTDNNLNIPMRNPAAFKILFSYLNPSNNEPSTSTQYGYINNFFDGFNNYIDKKDYYEFLNNAIDSIDVFGLGFTLQYILNCFYRHNAVSLDFFTKASGLFETMYDFNPYTRDTNIEHILDEYENILLETGVLTRLHKKFENNILMKGDPLPTIIQSNINSNLGQPLSKELEYFANLDPNVKTNVKTNVTISAKKCPTGKELNPKTNRCVNKCKANYSRNSKFKCVKNKTNKTNKINSVKKCPSTKELNIKTNRCVNKCKPNYTRNSKFKCVKNKTNKNNYNLTTLSNYSRGGKYDPKAKNELSRDEIARAREAQREAQRARAAQIAAQIAAQREAQIQEIMARLRRQYSTSQSNEVDLDLRIRREAENELAHLEEISAIWREEEAAQRERESRRYI